MEASPPPPDAEKWLRGIMIAVAVWGLFHAFGAWTFNHDARRPIIVIACVLAFLGFWQTMLVVRRRRLQHPRVQHPPG